MSEELPESRLATTDEFGRRVYIHPEDITGKWKNRRTKFYWLLILIYLILPWIYIDGKQWVLLDIPKREFTVFGNIFYGHDGPLLFFLALGFVILMAFITSIWGRVWCGWACPQTVFIDTLFRKIERLVEGNARKRKKLDSSNWNLEKIFKRSLKWILFLFISLHIVHSFLGYFVGTHKLFWITLSNPSHNWSLFITMNVMTFIILADFGWFREQFCIIACPYGRFQSVAMDDNSMIVAYDKKRGEPRRSKDIPKDKEGDCINCNHCVKACPTGIDIRLGTQLECIACTMCIDACDNIMTKIKKPTGLIRYTNENKLNGKPSPKFQFRSGLYLLILAVLFSGLIFSLNTRQNLKVQIIKSSLTPYQELKSSNEEPLILNHFSLKIMQPYEDKIPLKVEIKEGIKNKIEITMPEEIIRMKKDHIKSPIFFKFPKEILNNGSRKINLLIINNNSKKIVKTLEVKLVGPIR